MSSTAFISPLPLLHQATISRTTIKPTIYPHTQTRRTRNHRPIHCALQADPITENPLGPPKVLCVGETLFDLLSAEPDAPLSDSTMWTSYAGGAPANLACGLASLGTASALITTLGNDTRGEELLKLLHSLHVNVDGIKRSASLPTRCVFVRRDDTGERSFVGFLDNAKAKAFADTAPMDIGAMEEVGVLFYAARVLVTGTLGLAFNGSRNALMSAVKAARECQLCVMVDVNWRDIFWEGMDKEDARKRILEFVKETDWVKLSTEEVGFLLEDEQLEKNALENPGAVRERIGGKVKGILVTAGSKGAAYSFDSGMQIVEGFVEAMTVDEVVDTTGAGDAFLAGFLAEMFELGGPIAMLNGENVKKMVMFATAVAAFVVSKPGCIGALPKRKEVEELITRMNVK